MISCIKFTGITKTLVQQIFFYMLQCYFLCFALCCAILKEIIHIQHKGLLLALYMYYTCFTNVTHKLLLLLEVTIFSATERNLTLETRFDHF